MSKPHPRIRAPRFGDPGGIVFNTGASASIGYAKFDGGRLLSSFNVYFGPGVDYFAFKNFSFGAGTDISYSRARGPVPTGETTSTLLTAETIAASFDVHVGYNVPLGRYLSFYPRVFLGISAVKRTEELDAAPLAGERSASLDWFGPSLALSLPLLVHPTTHTFFGLGPSVFRQFGEDEGIAGIGGPRTTIGIGSLVGIHFNEEPREQEPGDEDSSREEKGAREERFGDKGVLFALGSGGASYRGYDGSGGEITDFGVGASFHYFIVNHVSVGIGGAVGYADVRRPNSKTKTWTYSFAPRIGVDIPLAPVVSIYTLAGLNVAASDPPGGLTTTTTSLVAQPSVLAHVAPHAFLGIGPVVEYVLDRSTTGSPGRSGFGVGANTLVGLWF